MPGSTMSGAYISGGVSLVSACFYFSSFLSCPNGDRSDNAIRQFRRPIGEVTVQGETVLFGHVLLTMEE